MEHYGGPPPENTSEKTTGSPTTTEGQTAATEVKAGGDKKID